MLESNIRLFPHIFIKEFFIYPEWFYTVLISMSLMHYNLFQCMVWVNYSYIFVFKKKNYFPNTFFSKKTHPSHGAYDVYFENVKFRKFLFKTVVPTIYVNSTVCPTFYLTTLHFITSIS